MKEGIEGYQGTGGGNHPTPERVLNAPLNLFGIEGRHEHGGSLVRPWHRTGVDKTLPECSLLPRLAMHQKWRFGSVESVF